MISKNDEWYDKEGKWYAVLCWVKQPEFEVYISETIPLSKRGYHYFCPNEKIRVRHTGLHLVDGANGKIVKVQVSEPLFRTLKDYFIFVSVTLEEIEAFVAGALCSKAAADINSLNRLRKMSFSKN